MKNTAEHIELVKAERNMKSAQTRHDNEQRKGLQDISVKQTRRMYNAVTNLGHAAFRLKDAQRNYRMAIIRAEMNNAH